MEDLGVPPPDRPSLTWVSGVHTDDTTGITGGEGVTEGVTPPDRTSWPLTAEKGPDNPTGVTPTEATLPVTTTSLDTECVAPPDRRWSNSDSNTGAPRDIAPPKRVGDTVAPARPPREVLVVLAVDADPLGAIDTVAPARSPREVLIVLAADADPVPTVVNGD